MGTGSGAMAGSAVIFLVLCSLPYMHAQSCCTKKIVSGAAAEAKGLVGTYTLLNDVADDKNPACFDGGVYTRDERQGEEYCFQAVDGGADIEDQCDAPTGTPPAEGETQEGTPPAAAGTPEGITPSEGETPEGTPPAESGTPEGTPSAEGETPEGTPPAESGTPEGTPPAEGETPEGSPPPF